MFWNFSPSQIKHNKFVFDFVTYYFRKFWRIHFFTNDYMSISQMQVYISSGISPTYSFCIFRSILQMIDTTDDYMNEYFAKCWGFILLGINTWPSTRSYYVSNFSILLFQYISINTRDGQWTKKTEPFKTKVTRSMITKN